MQLCKSITWDGQDSSVCGLSYCRAAVAAMKQQKYARLSSKLRLYKWAGMKILDLKKKLLSVCHSQRKKCSVWWINRTTKLDTFTTQTLFMNIFARLFGLKGLGSVEILVHSDFQVQVAPTIQSLIITELFYLCNWWKQVFHILVKPNLKVIEFHAGFLFLLLFFETTELQYCFIWLCYEILNYVFCWPSTCSTP